MPGPRWTASALLGLVDEARKALGARMDRLYPEPHAGFMKGLVLGLREDIDPERFRQFSNLGLTHILAISGLHVGVFLLCLHALLKLLRLTRESAINVMLAAVPFYVLLAGAAPSVVRAGLMAIIGLLVAKRSMLRDGLHLLAAAALLMLAAEPFLLQNISFQLSFIVTAGLITGVPPVRRAMPEWKRGKAVLDGLSVAIVAQLVSFPLTIYYFNQFHLLSLPANLLLVPLISTVVLPLGAASLLLSLLWSQAAGWLAAAVRLTNEAAFAAVDVMNQTNFLRTIWPSPPIWWIIAWYALLFVVFRSLDSFTGKRTQASLHRAGDWDDTKPLGQEEQITGPLKTAASTIYLHSRGTCERLHNSLKPAALAGIAAVLLLMYAYTPDRFDRAATVAMLDVGQGDAFLVRTPEGRHILIDGGGTVQFRKAGEEWRTRKDPFEVGRRVVVPLLMKRGVQQIDLLVISHLDTDHIGGLQAVLETIPVRRMLWNGTLRESEPALQLLRTAERLNIPVYTACPGSTWNMEKHAALTVIWPDGAVNQAACAQEKKELTAAVMKVKEQNEASVVLALELYERKILFTGDIGAPTERLILKRLAAVRVTSGTAASQQRVDLLKIAHHGSRRSSTEEWLHYWQPAGALISAGRYNTYGHPHPSVTGRISGLGGALFRTDRDGEVQFRITKAGIKWRKTNHHGSGAAKVQ